MNHDWKNDCDDMVDTSKKWHDKNMLVDAQACTITASNKCSMLGKDPSIIYSRWPEISPWDEFPTVQRAQISLR